MNKSILLLGLLPCFAYGMRKSPSMYDFQAEAKHALIYDVEKAVSRPQCTYCYEEAMYFVVSFNEFRFAYCSAHFKAAGFVQPRDSSKEDK
jgi:hypothetical protein